MEDIVATARFLAQLDPDGLKIHNLHIRKNAPLYQDFLKGEIVPLSPARHLQYVMRTLEIIPPSVVIMRLTCDTPVARLAAPRSFAHKSPFRSDLVQEMLRRRTWQGREYDLTNQT